MCLILRSAGWAMLGAAAVAVTGCVKADRNSPPLTLNPLPLKEDEAMARRDWSEESAWYANVGVVAGPTGRTWEPGTRYPWGQPVSVPGHIVTDDTIFLGNTALMPARLVVQPPWTEKVYRGVTTPPTYTASPPLEATNDKTR